VDRPGVYAPSNTFLQMLWLALLLLPFDIALRRLALDASDLRRALAWLRERAPRLPEHGAATPELGRLLDRKGAVVAEREEARRPAAAEEPVPIVAPPMPSRSGSSPLSSPPPSANRPTTGAPPSAAARTVRPEGLEPPVPAAPVATETAPQADTEEAGMSRLMAAKRRAQQRQEKEDK